MNIFTIKKKPGHCLTLKTLLIGSAMIGLSTFSYGVLGDKIEKNENDKNKKIEKNENKKEKEKELIFKNGNQSNGIETQFGYLTSELINEILSYARPPQIVNWQKKEISVKKLMKFWNEYRGVLLVNKWFYNALKKFAMDIPLDNDDVPTNEGLTLVFPKKRWLMLDLMEHALRGGLLRDFFGDSAISGVSFRECLIFKEKQLKKLANKFSGDNITRLDVSDSTFCEQPALFLKLIKKLPKLESIDHSSKVMRSRMTDSTLKEIFKKYQKTLRSLNINGNIFIGNDIFNNMPLLPNLNEMRLHCIDRAVKNRFYQEKKLSDESINKIIEKCPKLFSIDLSGSEITNETLKKLFKKYADQLVDVNISHCHKIDDSAFVDLPLLPKLNKINLKLLSAGSILKIAEKCPNVTDLHLQAHDDADDLIKALKNFKELRSLTVHGGLEESAVRLLCEIKTLKKLCLQDCPSLKHLKGFLKGESSIKKLVIKDCKFLKSLEGVQDLKFLTEVKIKNCGNPDVINNPNANDLNIDNLKDNQSVTKVKIIGNPTLRNINILQDCPNLVELYVIEAYLESLKLEKNNSKLEKLIIKNCNELIQLDLLNGKWLFDLRLQSLTKLKNLNINNCQKIHKLIVKGCGKLGSINLDNNSDLTFIGLLGIGTIESFKIKNCKRLVALEIRQNSPVNVGNNVAIDLGDCVALTSVYSDLKNVTFINMPQSVEGLETSYLVLPNLKSLNQCKKLMGLWLRYSIIDNILEGFEGLPELVFLNLVGSNVKADTKLISNLIKLCPKLKTICFECGQISEKEAKLAEKQHPGIKIIRWK